MSFFFLLLLFSLLLISPSPSLQQQQEEQQNITSFSTTNSPWRPTDKRMLLSPNSTFAAGFISLPNSNTQYNFSVWFNTIPQKTVVWSTTTAFTEDASLNVTSRGELRLIIGSSGKNVWPGAARINANSSNVLAVREDGSLVFANWRSFDYPTDTFLPNQNMNLSGTATLTSKNGRFTLQNSTSLVFNSTESYNSWGNPLLKLTKDGSITQGNGAVIITADFGETRLRRATLDDDGNLRVYSYYPENGQWFISWQAIQELCSVHGVCGPNTICMCDGSISTSCVCLPGFTPSTTDNGNIYACERKTPLSSKVKFLPLDFVNFTGGTNDTNLKVTNFSSCQAKCENQPNCLGFLFRYDGQGYCVLQMDRLLFGMWSPAAETVMFLKVDESETAQSNFTGMTSLLSTTCPVGISLPYPPEESNTTTRNIAIICTLFAAELISGILFFWAFIKKYIKYRDMARTLGLEFLPAGGPKRFSYAELKATTNDFSNCIGRGGFGDVYKGELPDKRVVAVKCLKHVTGGDAEFWAEVTIIARMHHLNLVRLWGFCAEKGQRILVYEYVPNGSLDKYLFPAGQVASLGSETDMGPMAIDGRKPMLDWGIRYRIALGVARAIAYLHEECLEWVLHCDIKPENILLGEDFCPKISDFGLAKLRKKEDLVSMSKIRGTRGYMAPEWIKSDPITPKADVYSFGMVLLEIVTGSRNFEKRGSMVDSDQWYLPRWAFDKVFKEMNVEDILDRQITHCYDARIHFDMLDRMVKTAMWCLQDRPDLRPSMGKVAKMLEGTVEITEPKKPTIFYIGD